MLPTDIMAILPIELVVTQLSHAAVGIRLRSLMIHKLPACLVPVKTVFSFLFAVNFCADTKAAELKGLWEFDDGTNLAKATVGNDLVLGGPTSTMPPR